MSMVAVLGNLLASDGAVSGFVGDRVYQENAPQGAAYPYMVLSLTAEERGVPSGGLVDATVEITVVGGIGAGALAVAEQVKEAVRPLVHEYQGCFGGVDFRGIFIDDIATNVDVPDSGQEIGEYQKIIALTVWYRESVR